MKKTMILMMTMILSIACVNAQTIQEPEDVGDVCLIMPDSTTVPLTVEAAGIKAKGGMMAIAPLIAKAKTFLSIKKPQSQTRIKFDDKPLQFIVKAPDDVKKVEGFLSLLSLESKKKERRYLMSETSLLGGTNMEGFVSMPYKAKKYGEKSYIITVQLAPGEYAFMVTEAEGQPTAFMVMQTFGVE